MAVVATVAALASPAFESVAQAPAPLAAPFSVVVANDSRIAQEVRSAISSDPMLAGTTINVDSHHGAVWLAGTVTNARHIARAVELARAVPGVTTVSTSLAFIAPDLTITNIASRGISSRPRIQPGPVMSSARTQASYCCAVT